MREAPEEFRPRLAQPSELSRKLSSTWAYTDQIGSRYCLMVWRHNPDVQRAAGTGQYQIASVHNTLAEAEQALADFWARIRQGKH